MLCSQKYPITVAFADTHLCFFFFFFDANSILYFIYNWQQYTYSIVANIFLIIITLELVSKYPNEFSNRIIENSIHLFLYSGWYHYFVHSMRKIGDASNITRKLRFRLFYFDWRTNVYYSTFFLIHFHFVNVQMCRLNFQIFRIMKFSVLLIIFNRNVTATTNG